MPSVGPMELVVILVIALLVLGPKRLPDAGRSIGKGMREFKDAISGDSSDKVDTSHFEKAVAPAPVQQPVAAAAPTPVVATTPAVTEAPVAEPQATA